MKKWISRTFLLGSDVGAGVVAAGSGAAIVGTSGAIVQIAPTPSVQIGALESDDQMFAFDEQQNVTLTKPLHVDITQPGTYDQSSELTNAAEIPAGTVVSSQFVNGDHLGRRVPRGGRTSRATASRPSSESTPPPATRRCSTCSGWAAAA